MPAKQKFKDLKEQLESVLKRKERSEELTQKREEEHLRTIAAMQNCTEKLEGMYERDIGMFGLFLFTNGAVNSHLRYESTRVDTPNNKKTVSYSLLDVSIKRKSDISDQFQNQCIVLMF